MSMILEDRVVVRNIKSSLIPKILIIDLEGARSSVSMDLHKEVFTVREGEELELVIGKELPEHREGVDFCARGMVAGLKKDDKGDRVVISLWGFLVILRPKENSVLERFSPTQEIYMCLRRVSDKQ